jgi:hypothetical protein
MEQRTIDDVARIPKLNPNQLAIIHFHCTVALIDVVVQVSCTPVPNHQSIVLFACTDRIYNRFLPLMHCTRLCILIRSHVYEMLCTFTVPVIYTVCDTCDIDIIPKE